MAIHERTLNSRASTFYLWHRNRIRFIILKENNPFFILFLPLIDVYTTLILLTKKLEILKDSKVVSRTNQKESVLKTGLTFILSMFRGYLWALLHFPEIVRIKIIKPNFLDYENKNKSELLCSNKEIS